MDVTVIMEDGDAVPYTVSPDETFGNLKVLVAQDLRVDAATLVLSYHGSPMQDGKTLLEAGVKTGDLVQAMRLSPAQVQRTTAAASVQAAAASGTSEWPTNLTWEDVPPNLSPDQLHGLLRANPQLIRELDHSNPPLAAAARDPNPSKFREVIMMQQLDRASREMKEQDELDRLQRNPDDAEAQRAIAERIRLENVHRNYQLAMEHLPESFARVVMLYVDCQVNGVPLKAFVDSGAQNTIMSRKTAEKCNLMHLLDTQFRGQAVGVGTATILGRIHMTQIKIGKTFFACSFTVLDQEGMDMLFGLDMLKRHRCQIDLASNVLRLEGAHGTEVVPFLSEAELKGHTDERFMPGYSGDDSSKDVEMGSGTAAAPAPAAGPATAASAPAPASTPAPATAVVPPAVAVSHPPQAVAPPAPRAPTSGGGISADMLSAALEAAARGSAAPAAPPAASRSAAPAAAAPAAASRPTQPQQQQAAQRALQILVSMGYTPEQALEALTVADGNLEAAADYLSRGGM